MRKLDPKKHPKLVKFLERLTKVLKIVAIVCFSVVIVLFACFMSLRGCQKDVATVSASADSSYTYFDTSNLIYLKDSNGSLNGITVSITEGNHIKVSGYARSNTEMNFSLVDTLISGTYSFSYIGDWQPSNALLFISEKGWTYSNRVRLFGINSVNSPFTVSHILTNLQFYFESGYTYDCDIYLMLNRGSVAYPYSQNPHYVYDQGYDAGESEGLGTAAAGFMYGASISGRLEAFVDENQSSTQWVSFGPYTDINYVDSGLSFQQFISYLYGFAPEEWTKTELVYTFANPVPYQLLKVVGAGNSTSFLSNVILTDENNKKYTAKWGLVETESLYVLSLPETTASEDIKIKSMTFSFGGGADGLDLSIYEMNSKYLAGFADGYNAGNEDGFTAGKVEGSKAQYNSGYSAGYQEGFNSAESGGFSWLISSVQAFLAFNFFGDFGIGTLLYVGLGMVLVTMFLKMFAGG